MARIDLPAPYSPTNSGFQRQAASALQAARLREDGLVGVHGSHPRRRGHEAQARAEAAAAHPVAGCPDVRRHLRAAERAERLVRDRDRLERRIRGRTESLARQFDRVLRVLEAWGYVDGWALTPAGERLARVYHEADLLVAECLAQGLLDGLSPAELAGVVSSLTYESRGPGEAAAAGFPNATVRDRWTAIEDLSAELNGAEEEAGLPLTRRPDPGFITLAHGWAAGADLEGLISEAELSGGDFVRNVKQLIDLLRQLGEMAPDPATARAARRAVDELFRGVVAASSALSAGLDDIAEGAGAERPTSWSPRRWLPASDDR